MSTASVLQTALLLALATTTGDVAVARAQSQATGDLMLAAPYGIPPDVFNASIVRTVRQSAVYVPGYNLSTPSAPAGFGASGNGSAVVGWQLGVAVAGNVPLTRAAAPGINTTQVMDATTLWLQAPVGVEFLNATAWKLCATVFPYVNMSAVVVQDAPDEQTKQNDGSCGTWLTDQCATALNENALAYGTDADGGCFNMTAPYPCAPYFMQDRGNGTVIGESVVHPCRRRRSLTAGRQSSMRTRWPTAGSTPGAAPPRRTATRPPWRRR